MKSTLLLDCGFTPVDIISWQDAIRLLFLNKVEVVEEYEDDLHSTYLIIKMPAVVRLLNIFSRRKKKVKFSRLNIYTRDKFSCQYCGEKGNMVDFTFDHVVPRSQGGKTTWINIVTACIPCNMKKGDRTPEQAGMKLINIPTQPKWLPAIKIRVNKRSVPGQWLDYLYWGSALEA